MHITELHISVVTVTVHGLICLRSCCSLYCVQFIFDIIHFHSEVYCTHPFIISVPVFCDSSIMYPFNSG